MTFSALNVAVTDLRGSLQSFVGSSALTEMTARPPVEGDGEISFLRLVAWSYVLLFEAGRISIPFLLRTSGAYEQQRDSMELVRALRTWSFHNLGLSSDRDRELSRRVHRWFVESCAQSPPEGAASWNRCFDQLCALVAKVVDQCQRSVANVLSSADDGKQAIEDLRHRLDRFWPSSKFDALVGDLALTLGVRLNAVKFRNSNLDRWRSFLGNISDDDDPTAAVSRLIERDLLEYEDGVLPIGGRDVMERLNIPPGERVGEMLRHARELYGAGVRGKYELLERLERRNQLT